MSVSKALDRFVDQYAKLQSKLGWPSQVKEAQWPSACYLGDTEEGDLTAWRPVLIEEQLDMFDRLSSALETEIHPDIRSYYERYWSDPLYARHPEGPLSLLFCWNSEDVERLRGNLVGHAMAKFQQKRPLTFFIGLTEPESEQMISVENETGEIWLERPGRAPSHRLDINLEQFLSKLEPLPYPD